MNPNKLDKDGKILAFDQAGSFYQRRAARYMDKNNYFEALALYRRAIEKEPNNSQYKLELADLYTEMGYYDESNEILLELFHRRSEDVPACIFGMGCNFMGLQEFDRAREMFERYLDEDEDGEFSQDVEDFLDILHSQEVLKSESFGQIAESFTLAARGKELLDNGEYEKAIEQFDEALSLEPELVFVRNNLSLAYYCNKQLTEAIEVCNEVLSAHPDNIHANCNMAIFRNDEGDKAGALAALGSIESVDTDDPESLHKVCVTMCELGQHEQAEKLLKRFLLAYPYDKKVLHYLAVSQYNQGKLKSALIYWDRILKLEPGNTIAIYYRGLCARLLDVEEQPEGDIAYHYQVPFDEIIRRIKYLNDCVRLNMGELYERWRCDSEFHSIIAWGIDINDVIIKKAVLNLVASFRDERAQSYLRQYLLRRAEPDEIKRDVFVLLNQMGAEEPYVAYIDQNIVEVHVSVLDQEGEYTPHSFRAVFDLIRERVTEHYSREVADYALCLWSEYVMAIKPNFHRIKVREAWAAAIEYLTATRIGFKVTKTSVCKAYRVNISMFNKCLERIKPYLEEDDNPFR